MSAVVDVPEGYEFDADVDGLEQICGGLSPESVLSNGYPFSNDANAVKQSVDGNAMTAEFIIVTRGSDINRNGHMVQIAPGGDGEGIKLDHYQHNPQVYFDHGYGFNIPIARSSLPKLTKNRATATATFSQILPEAAIFFGLIAEGILNTASVSFLPVKARRFKPKQSKLGEDEEDFRPWMSYDFLSSDLLEWSVVGVPADPGAIRKCLESRQLNGYRITQSLVAPLEKMAGPKPAMSGPGPEELKRQRLELEAKAKQIQAATESLIKTAISDCFKPLKQAIESNCGRIDSVAASLPFPAGSEK